MQISVLTKEELEEFKQVLLSEIDKLLQAYKEKGSSLPAGVSGKEKKWIKTTEVRKLLNISQGTLHKLKINGIIPYSRIGKVCLYDYDEINKIVQANKIHNDFFQL